MFSGSLTRNWQILARQSIDASLASEASKRVWKAEIDQWLATPPAA